MAAAEDPAPAGKSITERFAAWRDRLVGSASFQSWAARFPLTRGMARRDGQRLFDLVSGFTYSQILYAFVAFDLPAQLNAGPRSVSDLALRCAVPPERMQILCQAAASLGLLRRRRDGCFGLARLGAALPGVPGLAQMILHHDVLYRDLTDPTAFFRGDTETELADFWPYVFGATGPLDHGVAKTYSDLMADSQGLVAEETLKAVDFASARHVLDVGGGTGAFLAAVGKRHSTPRLHLFDLPAVASGAIDRFAAANLSDRARITQGSFRADPLPEGADTITLVRVLYDHRDETVRNLLAKAYAALPPRGRIVVSEPMSGGANPSRAADAYFAVYCMAMRTGTVRSADRISAMLGEAGFVGIKEARTDRPFITSIVTAEKD